MKKLEPYIPANTKIAIVSDFPEAMDMFKGRLFSGAYGFEFSRMFRDAGLVLNDCAQFCVFPFLTQREDCFASKAEAVREFKDDDTIKPEFYSYAISQGKNLKPNLVRDYVPALLSQLEALKPNLILCVGDIATAVVTRGQLSKLRGTVCQSIIGTKALPIHHPQIVLKVWSLRAVTVLDLMKAKREQETPELKRPQRELWINPTLEDLWAFWDLHLKNTTLIAYDIETARPKSGPQITTVGFANAAGTHAISVPFVCHKNPDRSYWPDVEAERQAWDFVRHMLQSPIRKVAQNGLYDITWLWKLIGIHPNGELHDTMLLHHSLQPELEKSLGFLGSVYTNEPSWKDMRPRGTKLNKDDE